MARVLIIDDDEDCGDITKRFLESGGHEAVFHAGPGGMVDRLRRSEFDLVLLDVNMPGMDMDGVELVKRIRGTPDVSLTKVLLYSTLDMDALRAAASRAGHVPCLQKSSTKKDLLRKVDEALEA